MYQTLSPTPLLLDATQTSMIEVPQNEASLGDYTCTASYHTDTGLDPSSVTETLFLKLNVTIQVFCYVQLVLYLLKCVFSSGALC